jgi:hypothetical protein
MVRALDSAATGHRSQALLIQGHKGTKASHSLANTWGWEHHTAMLFKRPTEATQKVATTKAQQGHNQAHVRAGGIAKHMLLK